MKKTLLKITVGHIIFWQKEAAFLLKAPTVLVFDVHVNNQAEHFG